MLNLLIEQLDSFESFFAFIETYFYYALATLFIALRYKSKNTMALLIALETATSTYIANQLDGETILLSVTAQFIIYGFMIVATKKSPKIAFAYIILTLYIIIKYFSAAHLASHQTLESYNVAALLYYAYFVLLIPVLYLLIRGLFVDGGKGYANRHINNNDINFYDSSSLYDINQRRFMVYYERRN